MSQAAIDTTLGYFVAKPSRRLAQIKEDAERIKHQRKLDRHTACLIIYNRADREMLVNPVSTYDVTWDDVAAFADDRPDLVEPTYEDFVTWLNTPQ